MFFLFLFEKKIDADLICLNTNSHIHLASHFAQIKRKFAQIGAAKKSAEDIRNENNNGEQRPHQNKSY